MTSKKLEIVEPAAPATAIEAPAADKVPDPFDLANLRLAQNYNETAGVKKLLLTVPVHKPKPQDFVRVHPDPVFRSDFAMIELKEDREHYIVAPALCGELGAEIVQMSLFTAINRQSVCFLWPVRLPDFDGRQMEWHRSMREAAEIGTKQWVRVKANRSVAVCCVARELRSGRTFRIFHGECGSTPPYATGSDVLFVAYYASAELGCYRALGWPMPERILDLFAEFRDRTNGLPTPAGAGLLGALTYFGLDGMAATEKKEIQEAIGSGTWRGHYTPKEILDYCESDSMPLSAWCW